VEDCVKKQIWLFLALAYAITWLVWIIGPYFGMAQDTGEYIAGFGTAGPALAAIFLSRKGSDGLGEKLPTRLLSFAVLWIFACAIYLVNDKLRGVHPVRNIIYYSLVALLAAIPAWILSGAFTCDSGVRELLRDLVRPSNWGWQAAAFFFWPAVLLIPSSLLKPFGVKLTMPESHGALWMSAAYGGVFFLGNFLFTASLEEPGWRGYLLPRLQERFSPLLASLLVWFPWALWHAPLDFHRPFRFDLKTYILLRVVSLIPLTIILTWFYNRSGGNLLTAVIFHSAMNTFPFVLPYYPPVLALIILFAVVVIFTDRMWRRAPNPSASAFFQPSQST
jgi:membrane protease YdiL (CAAX protease family)